MKLIKKFLFPIFRGAYKIYSAKERTYFFNGLKLKILPGVFHPGLFFSTKYLIKHLSEYELKNKSVLELGCGSGLISVFCAMNGAKVTASDISSVAVENTKLNAMINDVEIRVIQSDLFDSIPMQEFNFIIINPPYFPKNPESESEYAWFCGSDFQYYRKLFSQLSEFLSPNTKAIMILSEDCSIKQIEKIANQSNLKLMVSDSKSFFGEKNYILYTYLNFD